MILLDGSADAAAKLVALQRILRGSEEVARVQVAIAHKLEPIAVNQVRPGFCDDIHHPADRVAVLRAQIAVCHAEFLDGVGIRERQV